jgi:hypothetical protein
VAASEVSVVSAVSGVLEQWVASQAAFKCPVLPLQDLPELKLNPPVLEVRVQLVHKLIHLLPLEVDSIHL